MKHLTVEQRYEIQAYLKVKKKQKWIAETLGVSPSSISREISRNKKSRGSYVASHAHMLTKERKDRYNLPRKFTINEQRIVEHYLTKEQWSPQQIVGYCKKQSIPMVSVERIYQHIRQDKMQAGTLYLNLRHRLKHRKRPVGERICIKNRISIDQRLDVINNKQRMGDWEIDTIIGKDGKGAIVTMVERKSAYFMMKRLKHGKHAQGLAQQVNDMCIPFKQYVHSITADNGTEFAEHQKISKKLNAQFFFAHPYSAWERGLNEYTNKLIRQYIPKKTDFNAFSDKQITEIQHKINRRPRKNLGYDTPLNVFYNFINQKIAFDT